MPEILISSMKPLILTFFLSFIAVGVLAQYPEIRSKGDAAFKEEKYFEAAYFYQKIVNAKTLPKAATPFHSGGKLTTGEIKADHPYICYQVAESYRLYQNYKQAEEWYYTILNEHHEDKYPLTRLWYGVCLRANMEFYESIKQLKQFTLEYKGDSKFKLMAAKEIDNATFAKNQYKSPSAAAPVKLKEQWNGEEGDYAIAGSSKNFWFTSTRQPDKSKDQVNNIYFAAATNGYKPVKLDFGNDLNGKAINYGTPAMSPSGKRMYLTKWYTNGGKNVLSVCYADLDNGKWTTPQPLNEHVNKTGFNALQPFVTTDGKRLLFVSDKPGGQGGYDIWMSDLDSNGNPVNDINLGKTINTPADEEAPFYDQANSKLIYSSKGFIGLGGFDLFESYQYKSQWTTPHNMGYPINSSKDDLYFFADPDNKYKYYISSDRESDCCLNLFSGIYKPRQVSGTITECTNSKTLAGVSISLVDSASGKIFRQVKTNKDGVFSFNLTDNYNYKLVLDEAGYFIKNVSFALAGRDSVVTFDACLQSFNVDKPVEIKNILYDFNKADLRAESKAALDNIVTLMNDNPNIKIELRSHTDAIGNDADNLRLSQARAEACVEYIISKGIEQDRIAAKGYGKTLPVAPNTFPDGKDNPSGRQLNRRTEFVVKSF